MRLQGKLLLIIVPIVTLSLLTLGRVAYVQLRQNSERELFREMDLVLDQSKRQTQSFISTARANAKLFSNSNLISRYVLVEDETDRYDLLQPALLKLFASYRDAYPEYLEISLLLPDGYEDTRIAAEGRQNVTEEEHDTKWFRRMVESGDSLFSSIEESPDDGETSLLVAHPIHLVDRDVEPAVAQLKLRGYLFMTASLDFLNQLVARQTIGESGYVMILNHSGKVLFHRNSELTGTQLDSVMGGLLENTADNTDHKVQLPAGQSVVRTSWLENGLVLVAVISRDEYMAAGHRIALSVTAVTLGGILLTSILFYLALRSMVLRPITRLRETAVAIGNGQLDAKIDVSGEDEIGDLAGAFREMNKKLGVSMGALQQSHARIEQLAYRDSLTGLPNRRLFNNFVEQAMALAERNEGELALLFLDLDDFKRINDTVGHEAGDALLQVVAKRLQRCVRSSDKVTYLGSDSSDSSNPVARLGGDEFTIMLTNLDKAESASRVADRILDVLKESIRLNGRDFNIGTSIGIALYPADAEAVEELIKCADTAMQEAKRQEKNSYRFYGDSMQINLEARLQMEDDLKSALENNELSLHYQPQYLTASGHIMGVEALVRWIHPTKGMIRPDEFIPVAEETGLVGALGEWVMMEACRQWKEWSDQGVAPMRIAVNVSQRQFGMTDIFDLANQALKSHSISPEILELELTESCMMEAPEMVLDALKKLQLIGVRIAMDDFGTGYSSLAVLTSLPIDTLKIDRSFITGIKVDSPNEKVVAAILMLAKNLGLEVVAEGIEAQTELDYLRERQCDIAQGYYLSKPLAAVEATELLVQEYEAIQRKAG